MYVDLAHEFPAEEACGVFSPSPRLAIPGQTFLKFPSAAIVDAVCTLMSMSETRGHLESQANFLGPEQRPWWSLVGHCGEGDHFLAVVTGLFRSCVTVPATRCPQLLILGLFWSLWSRERCLVSTRAVGFHGDLDAKPTLSILQINYIAQGQG